MYKSINKKLFLILGFLTLTLSLTFASSISAEEVCTAGSVNGWAWSENIGWISLSCTNAEGGDVNYGLNIDSTTGLVSGYAWSGVVGWISFNEADLTLAGCPEGACEAREDNGKLTGWALVIDTDEEGNYINEDDNYDEWISLSGTADDGTEYGVEVDGSGNITGGHAWGDQTLGWVEFGYSDTYEVGDGSGWGTGDPTGHLISLIEGDSWPDDFNHITFSTWIYWDGLGAQDASGIYLIGNQQEGSLVEFEIREDGKLYLNLDGSGTVPGNKQTTDKVIKEEKWTHIAFTYGDSIARIYVNSELVSTNNGNAGKMFIPKEGEGFHIIGSTGAGKNFNGKMARIRVYHEIFE